MKTFKIFSLLVIAFLTCSCANEKNDPLQKSVLDYFDDEEFEQLAKIDPQLPTKCKAVHSIVIMAECMKDTAMLGDVTYERFIDFMDYRPDTAVLVARVNKEWNEKYADMDTLNPEYVSKREYRYQLATANLMRHDSICATVWLKAMSRVKIVGAH